MYWFVLNWLSSKVKPSSKLSHQLRGLIWVKFWLRVYSFDPEATQLMARASAAAQPWLFATPHASRSSGGRARPPGESSSGCHRTPMRASKVVPELAGGSPTGLRSYSETLK